MLTWLRRLFRRRKDPFPTFDAPWELTPMDFGADWYAGSEETTPVASGTSAPRRGSGLCSPLNKRRVSGK